MEQLCAFGLRNIETLGNGQYQPCCGSWLKDDTYFHDHYGSLAEAYRSEKYTDFRKSLIEGTYKYCNGRCFFLSNFKTQREDYSGTVENPNGPREVKVVGDRTCNLNCVMCRGEKQSTDSETVKKIMDDLWECRDSLEIIYMSGQGDPFFSKHIRGWLKLFKRSDYPKLKELYIDTNGTCMTPRLMKSLSEVVPIMNLHVSLDAATRETYEKIRRGASWDGVIFNISHIKDWYPEDRVVWFTYVINSLNYKEVLPFVELLEHLFGVEKVNVKFLEVEPRGNDVPYQLLKLTEDMKKEVRKQIASFPKELKYEISGNIVE